MSFYPSTGLPAVIFKNLIYVHPLGNDNNPGDQLRPLKHVVTAYNKLSALPSRGGTIFIAEGSQLTPPTWPVTGIHMMDSFATIPGAVEPMPVRFVGISANGPLATRSFSFSPMVTVNGGAIAVESTDQDDPAFWLAGPESHSPVSFENIRLQTGVNKGFRIGWDYARRNLDGSIEKLNVTHAERADGETVFDLEPYEFTVSKISRTDNVVKALISPGIPSPCSVGAKVFIDYTGEDFTPAVFTVTGVVTTDSGQDSITVASTGDNFTDNAPIATASSNCLRAGDYLTLYSVDQPEFPATIYRVISADEDTATVEDPYGFAPRSASASEDDIGTYATQQREFHPWDRFEFKNVGGGCQRDSETLDRFCAGPVCDVAAAQFFSMDFVNFDGYNTPAVDDEFSVRGKERRAAILLDAGNYLGVLGSGEINYQQGGAGGILSHCSASQNNGIKICHVVADMFSTIIATPAVELTGASYASQWWLEDVVLADNAQNTPCIKTDTNPIYWNAVTVVNPFGTVEGPCNLLSGGAPNSVFGTVPPNSSIRTGWYGLDRTLAGRHLAAARAGSPLTPVCDVSAISQDPTVWDGLSTAGLTFTPGQRDPFGGTGAVRIANPTGSTGLILFRASAIAGNPNPGDFFGATMWCRSTSVDDTQGAAFPFTLAITDGGGTTYLSASANYLNGEDLAEWNCPMIGGRLGDDAPGSGLTAVILQAQIAAGGSFDVYCPTVYVQRVTPDVSPTECDEWLTHLQPIPSYLAAGMAGTRLNQKLIAHGGLGTGTAYVEGAGAGQLTIVGSFTPKKYEPVYKADGTIKGYTELINATINP